MTGHRLRVAAWGLAVLLASAAVGLSPRPAIVTPQEPPFPTVPGSVDHGLALPPEFSATVDLARTGPLARVVASDIDRDGDIDVVANVGTLDLIVWTNDGAGHFTRMPASHRPSFQALPAPPSFDGESIASSEWIQNDHRDDAHLAPLNAIVGAASRSALSARKSVVPPQSGPGVRSSRAPPLALAL
jgi:hypothetical protein